MFRQPRFIPRTGVLMDQALVDGLIDRRDRRIQKFVARAAVAGRYRRAKPLDLRSQLASIAAVYRVPPGILPVTFFCRSMICHVTKPLRKAGRAQEKMEIIAKRSQQVKQAAMPRPAMRRSAPDPPRERRSADRRRIPAEELARTCSATKRKQPRPDCRQEGQIQN